MAGKTYPVGPAARRVAVNVRRFRGFMSYAELSRQLEEYGWPIPALGLRRIEAGQRRVCVDDLYALGAVLGCGPARIAGRTEDPE